MNLEDELNDMARRAIIPDGETFDSMMDRYEEETAGNGWDDEPWKALAITNIKEFLAKILIEEVNEALANGTKHFNKAGEPLETPEKILQTLADEGKITLEPRNNK